MSNGETLLAQLLHSQTLDSVTLSRLCSLLSAQLSVPPASAGNCPPTHPSIPMRFPIFLSCLLIGGMNMESSNIYTK